MELRRGLESRAVRVAICALASFLVAGSASAQNISFSSSGLVGANVTNPTSLVFGPDGRLYVAQVDGKVYAYTVARTSAGSYAVTATETIGLIQTIPNHDDNGAQSSVPNRQVTGILAAGTATHPVLYVGSSDPRIGAGGGGADLGLDTNSSVISRLTCTGGRNPNTGACLAWDMVHLVRGLPRSEENHSINGFQLSADGQTLFVAMGGNTNAGSPSNNFAFTTEYALSAAVLAVDLPAIVALGLKTDAQGQRYYYDLPTLDDPTRPNANGITNPSAPGYNGIDVGDPWGGNDGLNQAKVVPGGPVRIYATGFRNLYDLVITESGRLYGVDNGANGGWGGYPEYEESYDCTNRYLSAEPGSTGSGPNPATYPSSVRLHDGANGTVPSNGAADSKVNNKNGLHLITEGSYAGHPAPVRGNPAGAGLWYNGTFYGPSHPSLPADWPPVPVSEANPVECDFRNSGVDDGALVNFGPSTNGITEYTASNFGGALKGNLLAAGFSSSGPIYRVVLNAAGTASTNCTGSQGVPNNCNIALFSGFGSQPLDLVALGDDDPFPGTVWAATYGADNITVFEPADYDGGPPSSCTRVYSDTIDEDDDGYTNADEIDNGTDPCSAGSRPDDNDGTLAADGFKDSDLNDPDDDDDGVPDVDDAFALDAANGKATSLPIAYELFNDTPGVGPNFFGLGFTGLMTNGSTDYLDQFIAPEADDPCAIVAGGTAGLLTYCATTGDAIQGRNTQLNGFQFGVDVSMATGPFTIRSQINSPFFGGAAPINPQSQGIYLGTGDQDNYLKLVLRGNNGTNGFQVLLESAGVTTSTNYTVPNVLQADAIELIFKVNPATGTVQPAYSLDGGPSTNLGSPRALSGALLAAVRGTYEVAPGVPSALAIGTIAASGVGKPVFAATWDYFRVEAESSASTGQWAFVADYAETRHENAFVQAGRRFYLLGGRETQTPKIYDIDTHAWTSGATLPTGPGWPDRLHHFQAVELNGLIYAVGALTGVCCAEPPAERVYVYDPVANVWMQGPVIPAARRRGGGGAVVRNGKIYLVGGNTSGHSGPVSPLFDAFDPATGVWTSLPNIPHPRDHFFAVVVGDKLYAIGGRDSNQGADGNIFDDVIAEVDVFDFTTGAWTTLPAGANIPTPRAAAATGLVGGEIIVAGGEGPTVAYDVTEAFHPGTKTWRTLAPMLGPRHATQGIVSNGGLYVAAGSPNRGGPGGAQLDLEAFYLGAVTSPSGQAIAAGTLGAPSTLAFGTVAVGQSKTLSVTVSNTGGTQARYIQGVSVSGSSTFALAAPFSGPVALAPGASLTLDVVFTPSAAQAAAGTLTITHSGGATRTVALSGEGSGSAPALTVLYRVNAGGALVAATDGGPAWEADQTSPYLAAGGNRTSSTPVNSLHPSVPASTPAAVFESDRWDPVSGAEMRWLFPTGDGAFVVRLYLKNGVNKLGTVGARLFGINVEGGPAEVTGLDLVAAFGHRVGGMVELPVTVADGALEIEFLHEVDNPLVNAIEVLAVSSGGPGNAAPIVTNPGPQTSEEGAAVALAIAASDSDGPQPLAFSATGLPPGLAINATTGAISGTIAAGAAAGSPYGVTVSVSDGADATSVAFAWSVTVEGGPRPVVALYRVNAGGELVAATDGGPAWEADRTSPYLAAGGNRTSSTPVNSLHPSVPASTPAAVFESDRWDPATGAEMRWLFPTGDGAFVVRLYLKNGVNKLGTVGARLFGINVEGGPAEVTGLDLVAAFGHRVGGVVELPVTVADGALEIEFLHEVDNPLVNAIEILGEAPTRPLAESSLQVSYPAGWSLVGFPVTGVDEGALLPEALDRLALEPSDEGAHYVALESAAPVPGVGYWVKLGRADTLALAGEGIRELERPLAAGWNLISGGLCTLPAAAVYANEDVIPGTLFGFDGTYARAAELAPGRAYWVKARAATTLALSCVAGSGGSGTPPVLDVSDLGEFVTLTVSDASGHARVLYFGGQLPSEDGDPERFSLPPPPPAGAFDVRLAGDVQLAQSDEAIVSVQTEAYPLRVELGGRIDPSAEYEVEVLVDGAVVAVHDLPSAGEITLEERGVSALRIRTKGETLPQAFSLVGVYPNPVEDEATVVYDLPEQAHVRLEVYDVLGRRVIALDEPDAAAGAGQRLSVRAASLAAGAYFVRLVAEMPSRTAVETGRLTVIR